MPHRIHKCTGTRYDTPQLIINTYVSLMYELKKKVGKAYKSKSAGTGPSSYEKRIYRPTVSQRLRSAGVEPEIKSH